MTVTGEVMLIGTKPEDAARTPDATPYPPPAKARVAVIVLTLAYMLSFVDRQILSLLFEPMKHDLRITDFQASLLQGFAFAAIYAIAGIPFGRLGDRFSRRNLIIVGVFLWSVMTTLCGVVHSFSALFIGRAGVGIGEAALSPAAYSLLADFFSPGRLPRALAIYGLGPAVGTGLAYMLGGTILARIGGAATVALGPLGQVRPWQVAFVLVGCLGAVLILLLTFMSEAPRRRAAVERQQFSFSQTLCFFTAHWRGLGTLFFGMSMLAIQGYAEMAWLPSMLVRTFGAKVSDVGLVFGAVFLVFSVTGSLGGAWCATRLPAGDRRNPYVRWVLICAVALTISAGIAPLVPTPGETYVACAVMFTWQAAWMGVANSAIQLAVPNQMRATLISMLLLCSNILGLILGSSGVAVLTQFVFRDPLALRYSISIVATISGFLACIALGTSLRNFPPLSSFYALPGRPRQPVRGHSRLTFRK
jgi:MFS family permease